MKEFKYEIIKHVATLSDNGNGSTLQANVISYNDGDPKFDLRRWKDDVMYKGVAMSDEEAENLYEALKEWLGK